MPQAKLGPLLGGRREALKGTPEAFSGQNVADALGFSQAYISKLEGGELEKTVRRWRSERVWALLKAYRLSDDEARALAETYGLEIPHKHLQRALLRLPAHAGQDQAQPRAHGEVHAVSPSIIAPASSASRCTAARNTSPRCL